MRNCSGDDYEDDDGDSYDGGEEEYADYDYEPAFSATCAECHSRKHPYGAE